MTRTNCRLSSSLRTVYFSRLKYSSFKRALHLYGFKALSRRGKPKGGMKGSQLKEALCPFPYVMHVHIRYWYHPLFVTGRLELAHRIEKVKQDPDKARRWRKANDSSTNGDSTEDDQTTASGKGKEEDRKIAQMALSNGRESSTKEYPDNLNVTGDEPIALPVGSFASSSTSSDSHPFSYLCKNSNQQMEELLSSASMSFSKTAPCDASTTAECFKHVPFKGISSAGTGKYKFVPANLLWHIFRTK